MLARADLPVDRGSLVRVLAVRQVGDLAERERQLLREPLVAREPRRDRRLVGGTRRERLGGERAARLERHLAVLAKLAQHDLVLARVGDHGDVREVLRGRAQHRRAADVDHLDRLVLGRPDPRGERRERIEVDADDVERLDPLVGELLDVVFAVALGEDAGVDRRVERLDAAAEHLRRTGHVLDLGDGQPLLGEELRGAARRDELEPELVQAAREVVDALLLVDGDQGAGHSSLTTRGSRRCSTAWMRSSSVARGSSGDRLLREHGPGVEPLVDVVHGHAGRVGAGRDRVADRVRAGERRQERRVDVDDPLGEPAQERLGEEVHVAGEHDELDAVLLEPRRHHEVALLAALVAVEAERRGRDAGLARADERVRVLAVRGDGADRQPVVDAAPAGSSRCR